MLDLQPSILIAGIRYEHDVVTARQRTRQIAARLGFDHHEQIRIATAVSEIARNALMYAGGGTIAFDVEGRTRPQLFVMSVRDQGPGIRDLERVLSGDYESTTGMGLGLRGARRLMDQCDFESVSGRGTTVRLKKLLPRTAPLVTPGLIAQIGAELADSEPENPFQELQRQNRELLHALGVLKERQDELSRVNRELQDTNRGVIALYAELDEKADHLRRADAMKSRFLSNMSHEFRTPLHSILALSRLLRGPHDGPLDGERSKQVELIEKSATTLLELVNDLLDLAKIEAGKVEVHPVEFEVENLFSALRGMLRPLLVSSSVELVFEDPEGIPPLWTDEGKVSQILRNFLSNALKYTEHGEIRVTATAVEDGDAVRFSVADTGIGIPAQEQTRIFEEFTQVQNPLQRRVRGTGLGLPLCRRLATLLGGTVELESTLGRGSTFSVTIPARYPMLEAEPEQALAERDVDPGRLPLLVVEDDPTTASIYQDQLRDSPFRPRIARSIKEAADALLAERPAAIVLDLVLRGEDSWSWLAELKGHETTRSIPIMVLTSVEDRRKALALGADAYFMKPLDRERLIEQLADLTRPAADARHDPLVLIVDDQEPARYVLRQMLRPWRCDVVEAAGGREGYERVRQLHPDLVFLDLVLPDRSGFQVLADIRSDPGSKSIPVAIVTSKPLTDSERQALAAETTAVLSKETLSDASIGDVLQAISVRPRYEMNRHDQES